MEHHPAASDVVHRFFDAFNAHDFDAMAACAREDVALYVNQSGVLRGAAAFRAHWAERAAHLRERVDHIALFPAADPTSNRVAAEFTIWGVYQMDLDGFPPAADQRYEVPGAAFFDIRDGRIARMTEYANVRALAAQLSS